MSLSIEDFSRIEFRIGRIVSADDIPQARNPMYKLMIDFGTGTLKQCVGGIKQYYTKEQLTGKLIVAVMNLRPKSVAGVVSECMMLAAFDETNLSLLVPDRDMPLGAKVA